MADKIKKKVKHLESTVESLLNIVEVLSENQENLQNEISILKDEIDALKGNLVACSPETLQQPNSTSSDITLCNALNHVSYKACPRYMKRIFTNLLYHGNSIDQNTYLAYFSDMCFAEFICIYERLTISNVSAFAALSVIAEHYGITTNIFNFPTTKLEKDFTKKYELYKKSFEFE